jgi:hypothetical protein
LKVQNSPNVQHEFNETGITIRYDPRQEFATTVHPSYRSVRPLYRNAIWDRIQEKAGQLRDAQVACPQGIFLCDSGCELLRDQKFMRQVLARAFADNPNLSFISVVSVNDDRGFGRRSQRSVQYSLFTQESEFPLGAQSVERTASAFHQLPVPVLTPYSAHSNLSYGPILSVSKIGGWEMSSHFLKLSSRVLMEVLAGKVPAATLFYENAQKLKEPPREQLALRSLYEKGLTIGSISVEHCLDEDDDWIRIEFKPDPATSAFHLRKPSRAKQ